MELTAILLCLISFVLFATFIVFVAIFITKAVAGKGRSRPGRGTASSGYYGAHTDGGAGYSGDQHDRWQDGGSSSDSGSSSSWSDSGSSGGGWSDSGGSSSGSSDSGSSSSSSF
jgi:hypothetical protein